MSISGIMFRSILDEDMNEINSIIQSKSNLSLIRLEDSKRMGKKF